MLSKFGAEKKRRPIDPPSWLVQSHALTSLTITRGNDNLPLNLAIILDICAQNYRTLKHFDIDLQASNFLEVNRFSAVVYEAATTKNLDLRSCDDPRAHFREYERSTIQSLTLRRAQPKAAVQFIALLSNYMDFGQLKQLSLPEANFHWRGPPISAFQRYLYSGPHREPDHLKWKEGFDPNPPSLMIQARDLNVQLKVELEESPLQYLEPGSLVHCRIVQKAWTETVRHQARTWPNDTLRFLADQAASLKTLWLDVPVGKWMIGKTKQHSTPRNQVEEGAPDYAVLIKGLPNLEELAISAKATWIENIPLVSEPVSHFCRSVIEQSS